MCLQADESPQLDSAGRSGELSRAGARSDVPLKPTGTSRFRPGLAMKPICTDCREKRKDPSHYHPLAAWHRWWREDQPLNVQA
jgi:hypothetical protein